MVRTSLRRPSPYRTARALVAALVLTSGLAAIELSDANAEAIHRLPAGIVPTFQSIRLDLDPDKADYSGIVRVDLRIEKQTDAVFFHAQDMALTRVVLHGKKGTVSLRALTGPEGVVTASAPSPIPPGSYTLEIAFTNDFDRRSTGLYRLETEGRYYAFTQFEAVDARTAFPCWDEPSFKFPYQVTLVVPSTDEAVSNTPIERITPSGARKSVVFRRTKPLPSYLLAMAVGPLDYVAVPGTSIPTRIVTVKGAGKYAATAVSMIPPLLSALEEYFDSRYPYEKLDVIAIPEFTYGAMENPGAITFADRYLLFDPNTLSAGDRRTCAIFITHEIAHMWFGDLVTMKWWDDLWLNESFANWMGDKISNKVYPELDISVESLRGVQRAMSTDALLSTRAMRQPITTM
jgi:alanyl aminopeptidase